MRAFAQEINRFMTTATNCALICNNSAFEGRCDRKYNVLNLGGWDHRDKRM